MNQKLNFENHSRYFNNCKYVYPVVSRRAQGVSLGINLNLNNACNWRCVYCQVDGLVRGKPENVDLLILEHELDTMLDCIVNGNFIQEFAPVGLQRFNDICLAGNGEPTLSNEFLDVCIIIEKLYKKYKLSKVKTLLITNGSQLQQTRVQDGIKILANYYGEIWFKIDRINKASINDVNQINLSIDIIAKNLILCASLCSTFIQSCWFKNHDIFPSEHDVEEFIKFAVEYKKYFEGILLYSTVRPPALLEGSHISQVSLEWLNEFKDKLCVYDINTSAYV